jgi:stress response protein YsnF
VEEEMAREVFVAVFDSIGAAEAAQRDLEAAGIPSRDISLRSGDGDSVAETTTTRRETEGSFWDWLFGSDQEDDQRYYREHLEGGRTLLSVTAERADEDRIADVLRGHDLVKTEEQTTMVPAGAALAAEGETVVPTAREELEIGKRQTSDVSAYRIRRYVVERPAEAEVALHEETVVVERREPAAAVPGEAPFEDKTIEVTETREEPVVRKVVKPGEEVVVRKDARDRTEKVRETVRESKVEVDRAAAGDKPGPKSGT